MLPDVNEVAGVLGADPAKQTPNVGMFRSLIDIDDDGDFDAMDVAIIVGLSLGSYYFWRFAFKHLK